MLNILNLQNFLELAKSHSRIAVFKEISGDSLTLTNTYHALSKNHKDISILESCGNSPLDKYSYLYLEPYAEFVSSSNQSTNSFAELQKQLLIHHCYSEHPLCRYVGGAVGFISYDAIRLIENIPDTHSSVTNIPYLFFRFYRINVVFDYDSGKVIVAIMTETSGNPSKNYQKSMRSIEDIISKLHNNRVDKAKSKVKQRHSLATSVDIDDDQYMQMVARAKQYIVDGDAFQIVLSRTFKKQFTSNPFDIYRALKITNPSPYMFYLEHDDFVIVGASPEKLVSVKNGRVETNPIAGTRPRGHNEAEDVELAQKLLQDEKEVAEHMMLVDLGRNDLGTVCVPGSIKVTKLKEIQKLSCVMHITSLVEGELDKDKNIIEVITAVFPAGTLTGAPKIRAMEIIDELEISQRGLYGGAVCTIDNQNNLDACIAIRMAVLKDQVASIRAGAGIVFDSNPKMEAEETRHKAKAVLAAIDLAEGGSLCS